MDSLVFIGLALSTVIGNVIAYNGDGVFLRLHDPRSLGGSESMRWNQMLRGPGKVHLSPEKAYIEASSRWVDTQFFARKISQLKRQESLTSTTSRTFFVTDNGADPTGKTDSTAAIQKTINQAFDVSTSHSLMPGVPDLGGVDIHLEGGDYLISSPVSFPSIGGGNVLLHGGTLRASQSFPKDGYLIQLWSSYSTRVNISEFSKSFSKDRGLDDIALDGQANRYPYEVITIRDLMLDANFRGGGILIVNSLRTTVENLYISHFTTEGIRVEGGHETYISNSFIGQYITAGGDPRERSFSGVGIFMMSNDNVISNVVVFSAAVGISVSGQANLLTGIHLYNKATGFQGVGMYVRLPGYTQTRILGCYLDYTGIVAEDPVQLQISDSFFLGDANILLRSTRRYLSVESVIITHNLFSGTGKGVPVVALDESAGSFSNIQQTVVDQNTADGMVLKSTVARGTVMGTTSVWTIDFSQRLLFKNLIRNVQYSVFCPGSSFPRHALRSVVNNKIAVQTDSVVYGTVSAVVDQSSDSLSYKE
ncbi:hypothetical protein O6H91_23G015000 [Diphasiastrum complanatum]|uniref:Uncharacterized protein n=1 Tax=Diphasiastrum complanatum TaxID=34168 RepID=A0ACC2A8P2_DIPCM|nr:hypothetical protein O6H91_23G015000 [Diphasiastrum complanatum]